MGCRMEMDIDYKAIKEENLRKYGTDIGRIGDMLLANRYDDRTHFIYEILQNAEDALKKRGKWEGSRTVECSVSSNTLKISHFGKPFDEADVRGICGIGESTKEFTDIGRFGIGFKSVYAFTDKPEIHSGQEHFAVESYVWPVVVDERSQRPEETKIHIPFLDEEGIEDDILVGLQRLGPHTLLFLREIEEISWRSINNSWGRYSRGMAESRGRNARKVILRGEDHEGHNVEEEWIVFSRTVYHKKKSAGQVEVAFVLEPNGKCNGKPSIKQLNNPPMVVFFPTIVQTHMGFMVQGPYRTTPSRDNIPEDDPWNKHLVRETAKLLAMAVKRLKSLGLLDVSTIECLPLDPPPQLIWNDTDWSKGRFAPLFEAVRNALITEPLLPAYRGGHIAGRHAVLARTQELRDLISPAQLASLFQSEGNLGWLSEEITVDRAPEVHKYLISELRIKELTPESLVRLLTSEFLEDQSDEWMQRLYEFLNGQRALLQRLKNIPLLRMEDGSYAQAVVGEKPIVYLPGDRPTGFPTVKQSVCQSQGALDFLKGLGLRVPDPVDDVIENLLSKYRSDEIEVNDTEYEDDIERILNAFDTDSKSQKHRLVSALKNVKFLFAVDAGSGESQLVCPADAYMATERLTSLFEGVPGVLLIDKSKECLTGGAIRDLLRAIETPEHLHPEEIHGSLTYGEKRRLREDYWEAHPWLSRGYTREISENDYELRGLDAILGVLVTLNPEQATDRAHTLWYALSNVPNRGGGSPFMGKYTWLYYSEHPMPFPANFAKTLNDTAWVPDKEGQLKVPGNVAFKDTGWVEDPYLLSKIKFRPAVIDELAAEAGLEPEMLDLLKKRSITTKAQLIELLGTDEELDIESSSNGKGELSGAVSSQVDEGAGTTGSSENGRSSPPVEPTGTDAAVSSGQSTGNGGGGERGYDSEAGNTNSGGRREFISYLAVSPDEPNQESDGLNHEERIKLEDKAIDLILAEEPILKRTPKNNPGFDLTELGLGGEIVRFVEVKAMSVTLEERSATLTKKQFEVAQQERTSYWLYIVESAGDPQMANIVKINDPAGWANTFTFDHGWKEVSQDPKIE